MKEFSKGNNEESFDNYGEEKEKYLKSIMTAVGSLQSYFEDLEKVVLFLKVDKSKIPNLYKDKLEADNYYKYHYDNFIVRVVTSIDICGKIGNLVFNLQIQERYANWYSFTVHPTVKDTLPAQSLSKFSDFLDEFKTQRHSKVHQGQNPKNRFDKIIFWDTINKVIGKPKDTHDNILEEYTKEQIQEAISEIETVISEAAKYTFEFLDSMESRLDEIILN
ncbi:MAG: hypothetical protein J0I09_07415 [Sphingobacteriia bacterium]|nr:hypothetical protein [Sphingobacteriia bacterium]